MVASKLTISMEKFLYHKASLVFPLMQGHELKILVEDIKQNGLRQAVVLYEQRILDGRNRYRACLRAGVKPRFEQFTGDDPVAYVISVNAARRHLTNVQKRMAIKELMKQRPELNESTVAQMLKVSRDMVRKNGRRSRNNYVSGNASKTKGGGEEKPMEYKLDSLGRRQPTRRQRNSRPVEVPNTGCAYDPGRETLEQIADKEWRHRSMCYLHGEIARYLALACERYRLCTPNEFNGKIETGIAAVEAAYAEWLQTLKENTNANQNAA